MHITNTQTILSPHIIYKSTMIDLRSDVVTRAPQAMLKIMSETPCVNDGNLDDLQTLRFEESIAKMFAKDGAVFFLTASMANLASVLYHSRAGTEIIISSSSHSIERQSASFARIAAVQTRQIFTESGTFKPQQVKERMRKSSQHVTFPDTSLIFLENGTFRGRVWDLAELKQIKKMAEQSNVKVHIDGARIFNALSTYGIQAKDFSEYYDTMTLCFTKGLCCPIGAAVVGNKQMVKQLKNIRKSLGGGIFHTGIHSNAVQYALQHLLPQISKDNNSAKQLAQGLSHIKGITVNPTQAQINMIYWGVSIQNFNHSSFQLYLEKEGIKIKSYDQDINRYIFVTHYHIRQKQVQQIIKKIKKYFENSINDL